jgi:hypothetical protein
LEYKFNNVGPDLTGEDFNKLFHLKRLSHRRCEQAATAVERLKPWPEESHDRQCDEDGF